MVEIWLTCGWSAVVAAGYRTGLRQDLQEGCGLRLGGALKPSERELAENSRSRSAILWVLVKGRGVRVADVEAASYAEMGWGGTRRLRAIRMSFDRLLKRRVV